MNRLNKSWSACNICGLIVTPEGFYSRQRLSRYFFITVKNHQCSCILLSVLTRHRHTNLKCYSRRKLPCIHDGRLWTRSEMIVSNAILNLSAGRKMGTASFRHLEFQTSNHFLRDTWTHVWQADPLLMHAKSDVPGRFKKVKCEAMSFEPVKHYVHNF